MSYFISLFISLTIKAFVKLFYKVEVIYINDDEDTFWSNDINVFAFLNHTSLFEPLLFASIPNQFFKENLKRVVVPAADITMKRPIVGKIYKSFFPQAIPISRKRDETWNYFKKKIRENSLVVIAPEGRMMREDGLDKHGKPMTIKSGIADILKETEQGQLVLATSGGLHHVQKPGEPFFRLFKTIKISYEKISISDYKKLIDFQQRDFQRQVVNDLTMRMKKNLPS
ncbi:MAG: hypothetical protein CME63_15745 [Halobacteriovoraceae bacterium]|nr:hypothetical protein [Halobacteriovoraceae bacterium]|tara:strand:- start:172565 stop:173245 length:681 start_codon:yes stop_codon:yes gene_type:complete